MPFDLGAAMPAPVFSTGTPVPPPIAPNPSPAGLPMPNFGGGQPPPAQGHDIAGMIATIPALIAGIKDPTVLGAALTGLQRGRDRARAQRENAQQTQDRRQKEASEFYARMVENASQFDDPVAFEQWKQAIAPLAQHYGIPVEAAVFPKAKQQARDRGIVAAALKKAETEHGADVLNNGNYTLDLGDGRKITIAQARSMVGGGVTDPGGKAVPVLGAKPDLPNSSEEHDIADAIAEAEATKGSPLTAAQRSSVRRDAHTKWMNAGRPEPTATETSTQRTEAIVNGKRVFVFFDPKKKTFTDASGNDVTASATPIPPKETGDGAAGNSELVQAVLDNPELYDRLTAKQIGTIAPALNKAGFKGFGKTMNESAIVKISETKSAVASLKDLRQTLTENEQYIGPIAGLSALNPYSDARKAQAKIDLVKQRVGKALEGGVLRKEDEEKYKKILATLRDTPENAIAKVDQLITALERDMETFVEAQRSAGRRVNEVPPAQKTDTGAGGAASSALSELERRRAARGAK